MKRLLLVTAGGLWAVSLSTIGLESQAPAGPVVSLTASPPALATPQRAANTQAVDARYVGSRVCQICHASTYERWSHTRMANVVTDPKTSPGVVLADFGRPNPLVTFRIEDVALVYGTRWKQRYFIKKGDDYYPAPAQWAGCAELSGYHRYVIDGGRRLASGSAC